jgi:ABC-type cobalamin/Fe3+-siderophores transport system ATPase subunit
MAEIGISGFGPRIVQELSGGERQRVHLAPALVGETLGAVTSVHDRKLALRFATRVIYISDGAIASNGPPESCLTTGLLEHVFDIPMTKFRSNSGAQLVTPSQ